MPRITKMTHNEWYSKWSKI